jgi:hypothetical protein
MLTVPTTPRPSDPVLPDPGGWTGVCPHLVTRLQKPAPKRRPGDVAGIIEGIQSRPFRCPASINP